MSYAYEMTWSEFCIRMHGYNQVEETDWYKVREMAYASMIGSHMNPKKIPSKNRFIPIGKKAKPKVSKEQIERLAKLQREYKEKVKNG